MTPSPEDPVEVFVRLLSTQERMLAAYVMTLVPHPQDADDILQNAKVVMWRNFSQFRPGTNFAAWSRKVAFHQVLSHRKRRNRDKLEFSEEFLKVVAAETETSAEQLEQQQQLLNQCMARLPEDHRELLHLRYHEGLDIETMAARMHRTVAALYRLLSRVRRNLHDCVTHNFKKSVDYGN